MFFNWVWNNASGLRFIEGRLNFYRVNGERAAFNAGAPSVLISYGDNNADILENSLIKGKFIKLDSLM